MTLPKRKQNRLTEYDYSQPGCYFITICVKARQPLLRRGAQCAPASGLLPLTEAGRITERMIVQISEHYQNVFVDKYVVMPNHVHLILRVEGDGGRTMCAPTSKPTVARIIKMLKEAVTKSMGHPIWQKGYHDHIIRNDADYLRIWDYIETNPAKWREDCYYTEPLEGPWNV